MPNLDLSAWKLELPIDGSDSGPYADVVDPTKSYLPHFRLYESNLQFITPLTGATTPNATSPRTELKQKNSWSSGELVLYATVRHVEADRTVITQVWSDSYGGPFLGTIYDKSTNEIWVREHRLTGGWDKGHAFAAPKMGEAFRLVVKVEPAKWSVTLNGETVSKAFSGWSKFKFKFGAYGGAYVHVHDIAVK